MPSKLFIEAEIYECSSCTTHHAGLQSSDEEFIIVLLKHPFGVVLHAEGDSISLIIYVEGVKWNK